MDISNSKLLLLFDALSSEELKGLSKAVQSPFFNTRDEELRLFNYLLKNSKDKREQLQTDLIYKYVFKHDKTDLAKLRHVMTYLTRIIKRYITINEFEQNKSLNHLLYIRTLRQRNLNKLFTITYKEAEQYLSQQALLEPDINFYKLQLHTEYYAHSIVNRKAENHDLQKLSEDLDTYYAIQKLKHACNILSYKNIFQFDHRPELIDEVLALIQRKNLLADPLVNILYYSYQCLSYPDNEQYFGQLKNALLTNVSIIDLRELKDMFTLAINYCIKRLNVGESRFYNEVFDLYRSGIENRVFEENGQLSPFTYKNIVSIAIGLKEHDWCKSFIVDYKQKLKPAYQVDFYTYSLARYYFSIDDYDKVIDLLHEVEIKEQFTELDARVLLIKTYYELNEFNLLDYSISNLKQQIKRKKLQTYHNNVYKNFAAVIRQLTNLRPYDKKARAALTKKISDKTAIAEKEWLKLKLKEQKL